MSIFTERKTKNIVSNMSLYREIALILAVKSSCQIKTLKLELEFELILTGINPYLTDQHKMIQGILYHGRSRCYTKLIEDI